MKVENKEPEKAGRLTEDKLEQEAQDYIDGKAVIPDETLDLVSGGVGAHPHHSQVDSTNATDNDNRRKLL